MNGLKMRPGHGENVRGTFDQLVGQRLTAKAADVYALLLANLDRVKTRRLPVHGVDAGRGHFNVLAISDQAPEKPFCDRASTNVACANKEDAFHGCSEARG
jgi:hypothetical protein